MTAIEPKLTVDDLALMPDDGNRYELHEGELLVSATPSFNHQLIASNISFQIKLYLQQHPTGVVVETPGVIFDPAEAFIPDLVYVSCGRRAQIEYGGKLRGAPELIIEILSPGHENRRRDEVIKRQTYGKFGVDEYWIVAPEQQTIAVYRLRENVLQLADTFASQDQVTTPLLPDFALAVGRVFTT